MSNYIVIFIDKQLAMPDINNLADTISSFNGFYEEIAALLNNHRTRQPLSGAELRILYEVARGNHPNAGQLALATGTDPGYLTRIVRSLQQQGLILRIPAPTDARSFSLGLTPDGESLLTTLHQESREDILRLIAPLTQQQQEQLGSAMKTIHRLLGKDESSTGEGIIFRNIILPGDIGYLIHLHGDLYAKEKGYNLEFEAYVCKTFYEFVASYSPAKDRLFLATEGGRIVGAVAILGAGRLAQLRWFLVHPDYRGRGLGRKLITDALEFCREKRFQTVYLMTTSMQTSAIALYKQMGFRKTGEKLLQLWGQQLYEQRYDMDLM